MKKLIIGGLAALAIGGTTLSGALTPVAGASPEQDFYSQVYLSVHPSVTGPRLLELGNLTCSVRRSGQSTNDAKVAVYKSLIAQGVVSASAEFSKRSWTTTSSCTSSSVELTSRQAEQFRTESGLHW